MFSVTAGDWVALSALILTGLGMAGGIAFKLGHLANAVQDLSEGARELAGRVAVIERKIDRRVRLTRPE